MFYVYILESDKNRSYYIGVCEDFQKRFNQHNGGLVKSTKRYRPWKLAHIESHEDLKSARKRELQVKSWKKRKAIKNLIKHFKI